jgi:hypothetical protein
MRRLAGGPVSCQFTTDLARIIHDGISSVREIEKRLGLATVLSRHIQADPVAM